MPAELVLICMNSFRLFGLFCLLFVQFAQATPERSNKVAAEIFAAPAPDQAGYLVALQLNPEAGWHTYWKNPGDAGLATSIRWTAPPELEIGDILWPTPKAYKEGDLTTYGYGQSHTLLTRILVPQDLPDDTTLELSARWLVCKDICIPESFKGSLSVGQMRNGSHDKATQMLSAALQKLPETLPVQAHFRPKSQSLLSWIPLPSHWLDRAADPQWFAARKDMVDHAADTQWHAGENGIVISQKLHPDFSAPDAYEGVLSFTAEGERHAFAVSLKPGDIPATPRPWSAANSNTDQSENIWLILLMAFAGGLILNLMPCVFPVLSLKAMSLSRAESLREKRQESLAYTAGVVLSFLLVAALLLALRAGGAALGWGFQLQNPIVVAALACLMLVLGLALLGWSQIGMSLMGSGQSLTQQQGLRGAFFTGVLAVVVASPCSAPFMGSALGFAVLQPAPIALSIFAALGLGLAAPLASLPWIPGLAQRLPKPGPWMESLKHWMAMPMLLTALWLYWVLWRQTGLGGLAIALLASALISLAMYRKPGQSQRHQVQTAAGVVGLGLLLTASAFSPPDAKPSDLQWESWSPQKVQQAQSENRLVFVDFTADWCLSCIANERAVLNSASIQQLFEAHDVLLLKADWTQYDPQITQALAQFGRNGVPLYLLYPRDFAQAKVLPQILSRGVVEQAVQAAATSLN